MNSPLEPVLQLLAPLQKARECRWSRRHRTTPSKPLRCQASSSRPRSTRRGNRPLLATRGDHLSATTRDKWQISRDELCPVVHRIIQPDAPASATDISRRREKRAGRGRALAIYGCRPPSCPVFCIGTREVRERTNDGRAGHTGCTG